MMEAAIFDALDARMDEKAASLLSTYRAIVLAVADGGDGKLTAKQLDSLQECLQALNIHRDDFRADCEAMKTIRGYERDLADQPSRMAALEEQLPQAHAAVDAATKALADANAEKARVEHAMRLESMKLQQFHGLKAERWRIFDNSDDALRRLHSRGVKIARTIPASPYKAPPLQLTALGEQHASRKGA